MLTFGLTAGALGMAIAGAVVAGVVVIALGVALRRPLTAIPENTLKYGVGVMLAAYGTYWMLEGAGYLRSGHEPLAWPGGLLAVLALVALWLVVSRLVVAWVRTPSADHGSVEVSA